MAHCYSLLGDKMKTKEKKKKKENNENKLWTCKAVERKVQSLTKLMMIFRKEIKKYLMRVLCQGKNEVIFFDIV